MNELIKKAKILIVDDQTPNLVLMERVLKAYDFNNVETTADTNYALELYKEEQPDLLILDLHMPQKNGFAMLESIAAIHAKDDYCPILILTADVNVEAKKQALSLGATDFINKPFDMNEVILRIHNLLHTRILFNQMDRLVQARTQQLKTSFRIVERARQDTFDMLAMMGEYRDDDTGEHTLRVAELAAELAAEIGLGRVVIEKLKQAARLHDIGKIAIPDAILLKGGPLTEAEFTITKQHTLIGAEILSKSGSEVLKLAASIALSHHEQWDGKGYPHGLKGTDIPVEARLTAVADVYDTLINNRPYRPAWTELEALREIQAQSGKKFDPDIVAALMRLKHAEQKGIVIKSEAEVLSSVQ
ncbi:MAG: response regulator [Trueperaceae bacterium]|nr:response regulator [Trueperaceae bacterium]